MKHLKHYAEPLQAAVHTGRMSYDQAIDAAYRYGHKPKPNLTVDDVINDEAAEKPSVPRLERHCPPLIAMVHENKMHGDSAIEAAYKLGVEEREAGQDQAPVEEPQAEEQVEESQDQDQQAEEQAVEEPKIDKKAKPVRRRKKADDEE